MYTQLFIPSYGKETEIPHEEHHDRLKKGDLILWKKGSEKEDYAFFIQSHSAPFCPEDEVEKDIIISDKAGEEEKEAILKRTEEAKELRGPIQELIRELELAMSLAEVVVSLDGKRLLISYTAENRVDFREMVQRLASQQKKKVLMLQIGARDHAKNMESLFGPCGQKVCCSNFLKSLPPVSMNAAREQNIAFKGAESLTGVCGKLKCCLNFESEQYKQLKKQFPAFGGKGKINGEDFVIIGLDILNGKIKLKSPDKYITLTLDEFNEQSDGKFKKSKSK